MEKRPEPYSIKRRSLLTTTITLIVFLGIAGWLLDKTYQQSALHNEEQRLESSLYGLLAVTDFNDKQQLSIPNFMADERFNRPGSGLYAVITRDNERLWSSRSLLGRSLPELSSLPPGERHFAADTSGHYLVYRAGIQWEISAGNSIPLTFHIFAGADSVQDQVQAFRGDLWQWFLTITLGLIITQGLLLHWSLSSLNRVTTELDALEDGSIDRLNDDYPAELSGLTNNINHLLDNRKRQLARYRDALADLAHSLKTPLAILRGLDFSKTDDNQTIANEQIERMSGIVNYHLQRAATVGHNQLSVHCALEPVVSRLTRSLQKVYAAKSVQCNIDIADGLMVSVDEQDLMELLGNLLDNAFKWSTNQVTIQAQHNNGKTCLEIMDNGPGFDQSLTQSFLQRGVRADQSIEGQGIGLALAKDICNAYHIDIQLDNNPSGGAQVSLTIPI